MKVKPFHQWSPDAIWITFAISITVLAAAIAYLIMPPT